MLPGLSFYFMLPKLLAKLAQLSIELPYEMNVSVMKMD